MSVEAQATENKTITIDDKAYLIESLTEKGRNLIINAQKIEEVINQRQLDLSIAQLAKTKIIEELQKEIPNFTEAPAE